MARISNYFFVLFGPILSARILNWSKGHWLLSDALNFAISMNIKFKDEIDLQPLTMKWKKMQILFLIIMFGFQH